MQRLLAFIYRYRVFGYFLFLQLVCFWLLTRYNRFYNASFFNSSNAAAASIQLSRNQFNDYLSLRDVNRELAEENARLRRTLAEKVSSRIINDTASIFEFFPTTVISNDYRRSKNYITVNAGLSDGILPGMGVISSTGVVGIVKSCSNHFSTITSLLHLDLMISSQLSKTNTLCTSQWNARSPLSSNVKFIPRHIPVEEGDSVVTSGYNSIFPEGILIGNISEFELEDQSPFYEASIDLANDFTSLEQVYIVVNNYKEELETLESSDD